MTNINAGPGPSFGLIILLLLLEILKPGDPLASLLLSLSLPSLLSSSDSSSSD